MMMTTESIIPADDQSIMKSVTSTAQSAKEKNDYDALFNLNFDSTPEENPFIDLDPDASAAKEQKQQLSRKAASGLGPSGEDRRVYRTMCFSGKFKKFVLKLGF